jgi:hypothetical protein
VEISSTGRDGRRQFELTLKMPAHEALDRLSSRIHPERALGVVIGDWSSGYVGVVNGREFTFRQAMYLPRLYPLKAYGSVRDDEAGSVVTVKFTRHGWATLNIWLARLFLAAIVLGGLVAVAAG